MAKETATHHVPDEHRQMVDIVGLGNCEPQSACEGPRILPQLWVLLQVSCRNGMQVGLKTTLGIELRMDLGPPQGGPTTMQSTGVPVMGGGCLPQQTLECGSIQSNERGHILWKLR